MNPLTSLHHSLSSPNLPSFAPAALSLSPHLCSQLDSPHRSPRGMAPSRPLLPAVGTSYASLDDFKRDVYQRCLEHSTNLAISQSHPTSFVQLGCSLAGYGINRSQHACSCQVVCRVYPTRGDFVVESVCQEHTCDRADGEEERRTARSKATAKLARLTGDATASSASGRLKGKGKGRGLPSPSDGSSSDSSSKSDSESSVEGSSSEDEDGKRAQPKWLGVYPSEREVKTEMRQLCSIGLLAFPSPTDTFPSARDLFIHLYAFASQRGFSIYRYGGTTTSSSVTLLCERAHDRYRRTEAGLCSWRVEVEQSGKGWRVEQSEEQLEAHNHQVGDGKGGKTLAPRLAPDRRTSLTASKGKGKEVVKAPRKRRVVQSEGEGSSSEGGSAGESGSTSRTGSNSGDGSSDSDASDHHKAARSPAKKDAAMSKRRHRAPQVVFNLEHPRVSVLKPEIDRLAHLAPLAFPSLSNGIKDASYTKLRVHCLAAAKQRGFTMSLDPRWVTRLERSEGTAFALMCSKGHSRFGNERCEMFAVVGKGSDGKWSVVRESVEHNHPFADTITFGTGKKKVVASPSLPKKSRTSDVAGPFSTRPKPTRRSSDQQSPRQPVASTSAIPPRQQKPPLHRPSPAHSVSPFSTAAASVHAPPSPALRPLPISARSTPVPAPQDALPARDLTEHPFYASLVRFLRFISASPALLSLAPFLLSSPTETSTGAGLDSLDKLVLLFGMSDSALDRYIDALGAGEMEGRPCLPRMERAVFKKKLKDARKGLLSSQVSGEGEEDVVKGGE